MTREPLSGGILPPMNPQPRRLSVTALRSRGLKAVTKRLKEEVPDASRREIRQMACAIEKHNWKNRDKALVDKITTPNG